MKTKILLLIMIIATGVGYYAFNKINESKKLETVRNACPQIAKKMEQEVTEIAQYRFETAGKIKGHAMGLVQGSAFDGYYPQSYMCTSKKIGNNYVTLWVQYDPTRVDEEFFTDGVFPFGLRKTIVGQKEPNASEGDYSHISVKRLWSVE